KESHQKTQFFEQLLLRVRSLPGVSAAGFVTAVPGAGHFEDNTFDIEGRPAAPGHFPDAAVRGADPDYFSAMGIPLLRGRLFQDADRRDHQDAIVVSELFAKQFLPNEDPLGKRLIIHWAGDPKFEIVGVVSDVVSNLHRPPEPIMYVPLNFGR